MVKYCARGEIRIFKASRCEEKEKVCRSIHVHRINSISIFDYRCSSMKQYPYHRSKI